MYFVIEFDTNYKIVVKAQAIVSNNINNTYLLLL
jgi:hypothetical protein